MEPNQTTTNKKMMNCKTCGTPMAKSAKKCQSCGAKNPRKRIRKLICLFIIVGIIIGYPLFFIIRDNSTATITAKNGDVLKAAKLNSIYNEYILNDDYKDFVDEYLPADVILKGKITEIDTTSVGISSNGLNVNVESGACNIITFEINNEALYMISYDLYTKPEDYDFGKLKVGDKVEAVGTLTKSFTLESGKYIRKSLPSQIEVIGTKEGIVKK